MKSYPGHWGHKPSEPVTLDRAESVVMMIFACFVVPIGALAWASVLVRVVL
jgi:hypothetical protein